MEGDASRLTATPGRRRADVPHEGGRPAESGGSAPASQTRAMFLFLDSLSEVLRHSGSQLDAMLRGVVELLPPTFRYPEVCCARILLRHQSFATANWRDSPWRIDGEIRAGGHPVGTIEVAYLEHRPPSDQGPFTRGECTALAFLSGLLCKTVERFGALEQLHDTVRQLELEREALRQANTTLHAILSHIEDERNTVRRTITANVDKVLMPMLRELVARAEPRTRGMLDLLRQSLEEIASPFVDRLSRTFTSLTPLEIGICRMIRDNLTTKEIASIRHVSPATVARQREHIRAKLGIARSDANLATYLRTFLADEGGGAQKSPGVPTLPLDGAPTARKA